MTHESGIAWTHVPGYQSKRWNPVVGCTPAPGSEQGGCRNCYARTLHDKRHRSNRQVARTAWEYARIRPDSFPTPFEMICWARDAQANMPWPPQYDRPFAKVQLLHERLDWPLHWRKPRAVFVDSISDLFHPDVPDEFIDRVFAVMALTPQHIYMVLTKRPERMRAYLRSRDADVALRDGLEFFADMFEEMDQRPLECDWPLPNVWLVTSVEDQATADERIPLLLDTPAAVRGVSYEPALGPVMFGNYIFGACADCQWAGPEGPSPHDHELQSRRLDWIICGGESGLGARPMDVEWAASVYRQCRDAGVAYFGKQTSGARSGLPLPAPYDLREWPVGDAIG